jgi:hypothetical protein
MNKIKTTVNRFTNTSLHEKALVNAVKLLNAIGVEYAIQDHDGTLHGNGVLQTKAKRKPLTYPYGSLSKHVRPYVDACGINQTVTIPCHKVGTSEDKKNVILTRTEKLDDMDDLFSQLGIN